MDYISLAPQDWRDVPDNSIIFMDEIHKRPEYCDDGKMSQNQMIVDLTTHAHSNKDIYLITQDPERLNKGIRKLVEKMYLVKRPIQKPNFATIYEFERWLRDPWQAVSSDRKNLINRQHSMQLLASSSPRYDLFVHFEPQYTNSRQILPLNNVRLTTFVHQAMLDQFQNRH